MEAKPEVKVQEILSLIQELGKNFGITRTRVLEHTLSVSEGFFRKARHRKRVSLGRLLQIFERLEIQPHRIFQHAFGRPMITESIVDSFAILASRHTANHQLGTELFDLSVYGGKPFSDDQVERSAAIDLHNFTNPVEAEAQAQDLYQEILRQGHLFSAIRAAAVWASSLLLTKDVGASTSLIIRSIESARRLPRSREKYLLISDLLQRASHITLETGDFKLAILLIDASIMESSLAGDPGAVGKGLVTRTVIARYNNDHDLAGSSLEASTVFFKMSENSQRSIYSLAAWVNLAYGHFFSEKYSEATSSLNSISENFKLENMPSKIAGRYLWLRALVVLRKEGIKAANPKFSDAFDRLVTSFPLDAGVVCVSALLETDDGDNTRDYLWMRRLFELAHSSRKGKELRQFKLMITTIPWRKKDKSRVNEIMKALQRLLAVKYPDDSSIIDVLLSRHFQRREGERISA